MSRSRATILFGEFMFKSGITKKKPRMNIKKMNKEIWWSRGGLDNYRDNYL